jgi:outer membrane protein OmpA-like peptidoglycan-associated protein
MAPTPEWLSSGRYDTMTEFAELRELLLGGERRQLDELRQRLDALGITPEQLAELLPQAIALRASQDRQLARALAPTVEEAIDESVRRNPRQIATAIFPVLGPAIRKAIAEAMASLVASINRAIEHSVSVQGIRWRIAAWRSGVPYAEIVLRHALVYQVEQVYLIHGETGLLLSHAALNARKADDADLISGMLTAIRDFVADSFAGGDTGGLRTFTVGELTVMVEQGPQAILAAVVRGQAPDSLLRRLQETLETVHFRLAGAFAEFDGDTVPFEPARPLLAECLQTVTRTPEAKRGIRALAWTVPLFLLLAIPTGLIIRSNLRWNAAVARLRAEPGIVLVHAERSGGRWHFTGLRDPLAANPSALLAAAGADAGRVTARWDLYHSFDPSLVLERTRRILLPPPGVTLSLSGDTVRARGPGPVDWVAKAASPTALPAGVSYVDLSEVELRVADSLIPVVGGIEQARVQFAVGSSALDAEAGGVLRSVMEQYRRLVGAMPPGYFVAIDLTGRTDARGSDAANLNLSSSRSEVVRNALSTRGIPPEAMRPVGIGTSSPLDARDAGERERINRSVSFRVALRSTGSATRPAP